MKRFVIILVLACALVAVGIAAKPLLAGAQGSSAGMCCSDGNMSCCCDKCKAKCDGTCCEMCMQMCGDKCKCKCKHKDKGKK